MEKILSDFPPVGAAFSYGSKSSSQAGISSSGSQLDFVFSVDDPVAFHAENLERNPEHYPGLARVAGADAVAGMQDAGAGIWWVVGLWSRGECREGAVT